MNNAANFFDLKGQTITELIIDSDSAKIKTKEGNKYSIFHDQYCCEHVRHVKTIGDITNQILNEPVILAEEDNPYDPSWYPLKEFSESHTWTAYYLETSKGRVEIWFLGESNGYYSETMSFVKHL